MAPVEGWRWVAGAGCTDAGGGELVTRIWSGEFGVGIHGFGGGEFGT